MSSVHSGLWGLEIYKDEKSIRRVTLESDTTYIGRLAENHIVLEDIKVSRSHAIVQKEGDGYTITDQQSENGTLLNGDPVSRESLKMGDTISIGGFELRVVQGHAKERADREQHLEREDSWNIDATRIFTNPNLAQNTDDEPLKLSIELPDGRSFDEIEIDGEAFSGGSSRDSESSQVDISIQYRGRSYRKIIKI